MKYREGYKYQLAAPESFITSVLPSSSIESRFMRLTKGGVLTLMEGYAWDGASGALDTKTNMAASAAHDAFCQMVQCGLLSAEWKRQADLEYFKLCRQYGMLLPRAITHLGAIQFHNWDRTKDKPIIEVLPVSP